MSPLGRTVVRLVAAGLCAGGAAVILGILSGDFTDGDLKVIGTSGLFAVAVSTGGAGEGLRQRRDEAMPLGIAVLAASVAGFALITYGMWAEPSADGFWRAVGVIGIVALDGAHACFVLAHRRPNDPPGATAATATAVLAAAISGTLGTLAVLELVDGPWQPLAVVLVVQLLASALALLLRRLDDGPPATPTDPFGRRGAHGMATELHSIADALDAATTPAAVRAQADKLRQLARSSRQQ